MLVLENVACMISELKIVCAGTKTSSYGGRMVGAEIGSTIEVKGYNIFSLHMLPYIGRSHLDDE